MCNNLRFLSRFGRFHTDFLLKERTVRVPLPFSRNRPENHFNNLGKALGEGFGLLCAPFTSLRYFHLSIPFTSLSLSLSLSLFLSISLLLPFFLSLSFSLFSPSFSLAYLMDVFVLVYTQKQSSYIRKGLKDSYFDKNWLSKGIEHWKLCQAAKRHQGHKRG